MQIENRIAKRQKEEQTVEYLVNGEPVKLSAKIVRMYLTSGNGNVTDQEIVYFLNICKHQKLNPFTRDAYLCKFGSQPATIIVGKDALLKRAMHNPSYAGHQAGVIVQTTDGKLEYRTGSLILDGEKLVGGWAKVYVKGYEVPIESAVSLREYIGVKNDGRPNSMWSGKPGTMIRKVALTTALREAFPDTLAQLYSAEEVGAEGIDEAPAMPIDVEPVEDIQPETEAPVVQQEAQQSTMEELPGF